MKIARNFLINTALVLFSALLACIAIEFALAFKDKGSKIEHFVWQPRLKHTFYPDTLVFYGIKGAKHFSISEQGFRGKPFKGTGQKIICLGGSTTECLYLSDSETWMQLLEDRMNSVPGKTTTQIGSVGKSGCGAIENYLHLKYYVKELGNANTVIMMIGFNDMMKRLSKGDSYIPMIPLSSAMEDSLVRAIFLPMANTSTWWKFLHIRSNLRELLQADEGVKWQHVQDDRGEIYKTWMAYRQNSQLIDTLPDLTEALNEFENTLEQIHQECRKQKLELVLVTQPALYKDSTTTFENQLFWMGGIGDFQQGMAKRYYTPSALAQALEAYNDRIRKYSEGHHDIIMIDLAKNLPRDTSVFYDDCHFNENGARKVSEAIYQAMRKS